MDDMKSQNWLLLQEKWKMAEYLHVQQSGGRKHNPEFEWTPVSSYLQTFDGWVTDMFSYISPNILKHTTRIDCF